MKIGQRVKITGMPASSAVLNGQKGTVVERPFYMTDLNYVMLDDPDVWPVQKIALSDTGLIPIGESEKVTITIDIDPDFEQADFAEQVTYALNNITAGIQVIGVIYNYDQPVKGFDGTERVVLRRDKEA